MQESEPDFAKEQKWAEEGFTSSQFNLATMYDLGKGVSRDLKQAMLWYEKAAEQGHLLAKRRLVFLNGQKEAEQLRESLRREAEQGDVIAQYKLASTYKYPSDGLVQDLAQAAYWYEKAAEQGLAKASLELHYMYTTGDEKSLFWLTKAAEQGNALGQYWLAASYEQGFGGVAQDYEKAVFWFEKAAEQDISHAMAALVEIYGNDPVQNPEKVAFWRAKFDEKKALSKKELDQENARRADSPSIGDWGWGGERAYDPSSGQHRVRATYWD